MSGSADTWNMQGEKYENCQYAKEMHDAITLTVHTADGTKVTLRNSEGTAYADNTMTYAVADYISSVQHTADASSYLKTLTNEMMAYGEFTQHYFGYNTNGIQPTLQSLDKTTGMKSHKLYNDFLAVDRKTYDNPKTYIVTDEVLAKYKISKNKSDNPDDLIHTRDGLNREEKKRLRFLHISQ